MIDWQVSEHPEIVKALLTGFYDFGGAPIMSLVNQYGEPIFGSMKAYEMTAKGGESIMGPTKVREMNKSRNSLQMQYLQRWMNTKINGEVMDGIIMAATPWAAARLGVVQEMDYCGFTGAWNLLGKLLEEAP